MDVSRGAVPIIPVQNHDVLLSNKLYDSTFMLGFHCAGLSLHYSRSAWIICYLFCCSRHVPNHASKEAVIIMGSIASCDPGNIFSTIDVSVLSFQCLGFSTLMTLYLVLDKGSSSNKALNKPCVEFVKGSLNEKALNDVFYRSLWSSLYDAALWVSLLKCVSARPSLRKHKVHPPPPHTHTHTHTHTLTLTVTHTHTHVQVLIRS